MLGRQILGKFISHELAKQRSNHTNMPTRIILGDDYKHWVVTVAEAARLVKEGYELAPE